jgi:tetratricopeptide (TPR) repeat protein
VHLARIAAHDGRMEDLDDLVRRLLEANPASDRVLPGLAMQAYAHRNAEMIDEITRRLSQGDDSALALAMWDVTLYSASPSGPESIARLATDSSRPPEVRAAGHNWLAHVEASRGRIARSREEMAAVERLDPAQALEYGTMLALLPWMETGEAELRARRKTLEDLDPASIPPSGHPAVFFRATNDIHAQIRSYLLGLLCARLGDADAAGRHAAELPMIAAPRAAGTLLEDLGLSIQSEIRRAAGRADEALALLQRTRRQTWYEPMIATYFWSETYERFMMAELLREQGRDEEALDWYANLAASSPLEIVYRPLLHLRQAWILEDLGRLDAAADHLRQFIAMWSDCDPVLAPMVEVARRRLEAMER